MLSFSSIIKKYKNCSSEALNCCLKRKIQNPSFRGSTVSSGMRKYSARAIYMQRRCGVKCVKDVVTYHS